MTTYTIEYRLPNMRIPENHIAILEADSLDDALAKFRQAARFTFCVPATVVKTRAPPDLSAA